MKGDLLQILNECSNLNDCSELSAKYINQLGTDIDFNNVSFPKFVQGPSYVLFFTCSTWIGIFQR